MTDRPDGGSVATDAGIGAERRRRSLRSFVAVCVAISVMEVAALVVGPAQSGLGILAAGVCFALVLGGLANPVIAVLLLLLASFFRLAMPATNLPVEPFVLAFGGVLASATIAIVRKVGQRPTIGALEIVMMLYVLWNIVSAIMPHTYPALIPGTGEELDVWRFILTGTLLPFVMYIMGRFFFDREPAIRVLLWTVIALTAYSATVSIMPFIGLDALVWPRYIAENPGWPGRAVGIFNQPVVNGLMLTIGFTVALHLARQSRNSPIRQAVLYGVAAAAALGVYFTYTRAAWLAFAVVLVVGAVLARGFRAGFVLALVTIAVVIVANWSTFIGSDREAGGVASTNELDDRLNSAATSFWAIGQRPIEGWGIGRFVQVNTYHHKQWSQDVDWERGYGISSHQNELGIGVELGLVGLALWLAILILILRRLITSLRVVRGTDICGRGLVIIAFLGFLVWLSMGASVDLRYLDFANALPLLLAGIAVGHGERQQNAAVAPSGRSGRRFTPGHDSRPLEKAR